MLFSEIETEKSLASILQLKDTVVMATNVLMLFTEIPPNTSRKKISHIYNNAY